MIKRMLIPYFKPHIDIRVASDIKTVIKSGLLVNGKYTDKLSKELSNRYEKKALPVDSGTSALILALRVLSCKNKYVLMPSFVCSALLQAIFEVGAKPILYDIEYPYIYFDVKKIKKIVPKNVGAVIVVHLFGRSANVEEFIGEFGEEKVIENCATSFGTKRNNTLCGAFSNIAIISFGATKYINSIKGGALLVKDNKDFAKASDLYYYDKKDTLEKRYNFLSNEVSNLIAYNQIKNFNGTYIKYKRIYNHYKQHLTSSFNYLKGSDKENNFYKFILLSYKKDFLKTILQNNGIEAKEPVYIPIHRILKLDNKKFCGSEEFYRTALSLPLYKTIQTSQINKIINILNYFNEDRGI